MDDVESFLELLSEHVDNELNLPADEITDARYKRYEKIKDFLYTLSSPVDHEEWDYQYNEINKKFGSKIWKDANLYRDVENTNKRFDSLIGQRETKMARTIVKYLKKAKNSCMGIFGAHHIRNESKIFPILDKNEIPYLAINIMNYNHFIE